MAVDRIALLAAHGAALHIVEHRVAMLTSLDGLDICRIACLIAGHRHRAMYSAKLPDLVGAHVQLDVVGHDYSMLYATAGLGGLVVIEHHEPRHLIGKYYKQHDAHY